MSNPVNDYPLPTLIVDQIAALLHPDSGWLPLQTAAALVEQLWGECDCRSDGGDCEHRDFLRALCDRLAGLATERKVRP